MPDTCDVVVLLSGTGSNLQALIDSNDVKDSPANIRAVISNRADAYGLQRAQDAGIDTRVLDHTAFEGREAFDAALIEVIDTFNPQLVVLAGFMRILSAEFVRHYQGRLLNIHPSLLPKYKGLHTHQRALEAGTASGRVHIPSRRTLEAGLTTDPSSQCPGRGSCSERRLGL